MSLSSKIVLLTATGITCSIIVYVHSKQQYDLEKLHMGVMNDIEKQRRRQIENLYKLQQQRELTKELQKDQIDKNKDIHT